MWFTSTAQTSLQGGQNKPATGAFSKPAPPSPNASRLALSMILQKKCSVIKLFEPKLEVLAENVRDTNQNFDLISREMCYTSAHYFLKRTKRRIPFLVP